MASLLYRTFWQEVNTHNIIFMISRFNKRNHNISGMHKRETDKFYRKVLTQIAHNTENLGVSRQQKMVKKLRSAARQSLRTLRRPVIPCRFTS